MSTAAKIGTFSDWVGLFNDWREEIGVNLAVHGVSRLLAGPRTFATSLVTMFHATPLPGWSVLAFGLALPWVEAVDAGRLTRPVVSVRMLMSRSSGAVRSGSGRTRNQPTPEKRSRLLVVQASTTWENQGQQKIFIVRSRLWHQPIIALFFTEKAELEKNLWPARFISREGAAISHFLRWIVPHWCQR